MKAKRATKAGAAVTALIVEVFRLNGRLLTAGDRLVEGLGMTSARWQVLGAVAMAPAPGPVAHLARDMGLNRQGVQRIVNELAGEGWVAFAPNPHHRRAKLVVLTTKGAKNYASASRLQVPWVNALAKGLDPSEVTAAKQLIETLRTRLERGSAAEHERNR